MTTMAADLKLSARFLRVSGGSQSEDNQVRLIETFERDNGYAYSGITVKAHGKSAAKEEHLDDLETAVRLVETGKVHAVIVWELDRASRKGADQFSYYRYRCERAGGKLLIATDELANRDDMVGAMVRTMKAEAASEEGKLREKRKAEGFATTMGNGAAANGKVKFGWKVEGGKREKRWIPDAGKAAHVVHVHQMAADGYSGRKMADYLNANGCGAWDVPRVRSLILDMTYAEGIHRTFVNRQPYEFRVPPLVTHTLKQAAIAGMSATSPRKERGRPANALLAGLMPCPYCGIPRNLSPDKNRYRCRAKGHGSVVREVVERFAVELIEGTGERPVTTVEVGGNLDELAEMRASIESRKRTIGTRGLSIPGMVAELGKIEAELAALPPEVPPHVMQIPGDKTYGQMFADADDKRQFLRDYGIKVTAIRHKGVPGLTGVSSTEGSGKAGEGHVVHIEWGKL